MMITIKELFTKNSIAFVVLPALIGLLVIAGWYLQIPELIQLNPHFVPMQYNTALCFVLISLGAYSFQRGFLKMTAMPTGLVLLIATITLFEYMFGFNLGVDELFVEHYITTDTPFPGRMSVNTALCFFLLSLPILFSILRPSRLVINLSVPFCAFVCAVGSVSMIGYIIDLESAYSWSSGFSSMAFHTSLCFVLVSISMMFSFLRRDHNNKADLPISLASFFMMTASFFTISLYQQFHKQEQHILSQIKDMNILQDKELSALLSIPTAEIVLYGGLFLSVLLGIAAYVAIKANEQRRDLEKQSQALNDANEELEEFSYRTSHDLRSPLISSIKLMDLIGRFIDEKKTDQAKEMLGMATQSLKKLEALVEDLLELTRAKSEDEENAHIRPVDVIDGALKKFSHMDGFDKITIFKEINYQGMVWSKPSRLSLIIENLISNAIKYEDLTKDESFIKIIVEDDDKHISIAIDDNGLGIPEKNQNQLFTMFKRFHAQTSYGSGLGLYMIKKSADIINAEIIYEDTGVGSRFTLKLPY